MSKLSDATLRYLEAAIEAVKSHAEEIEPAHLGMIARYFNDIAKRNSSCSEDAAELDFDYGLLGDLTDETFEMKLKSGVSS